MDLTQFDGHTPGPWQCILNNPIAHGDVVTSEGDVVTRIRGWGWLQKLPDGAAQQDANGRLVAAAPELLAEVRRLTAEADAMRRERDELAARLAEMDRELGVHRLYARALCRAVDAATDFAGTVGGGSSWWEEVWAYHAAEMDRTRPAPAAAPEQASMSIEDAMELHAIADGTKIRPAAAGAEEGED